MSARAVIDVSKLPTYAYGHRSIMWWGTLGMVAIEGTVFAIALVVYYYLRGLAPEWPIASAPPDLRWGTVMTALLLVSGMGFTAYSEQTVASGLIVAYIAIIPIIVTAMNLPFAVRYKVTPQKDHGGWVVYTSFHNTAQTGDDVANILKFLILHL